MKKHVKDSDEEEKELREAFQVFDKNGDGFVVAEEIKSVMKSIGKQISDAEIEEILGKADINGDGRLDYAGRYPN